jgi:glycosyltransferase involved in cell wall biosynthesis
VRLAGDVFVMTRPLDDLSIVMPVYNEAAAIERVLRELHSKVASRLQHVEFVVAEDGSSDATPQILARLAPELGLRLVSGRERKGYTRAVKDALAQARGEWIFFTDSDGQHEPDDLFAMAELAERERADIVAGVKTPRRDPLPRRLLSGGLRMANAALLGARFRDANCGFRLMRRSVVERLLPQVDKLPLFVNTELLLRADAAGYRIVELPVRHYARSDGGSRGLPPARIPGEVVKLLRGLLALRVELGGARHARQRALP